MSIHRTDASQLSPKQSWLGEKENIPDTVQVSDTDSSPSTPLLARLSSSTGLPSLPDTEPSSSPRGLAIRFHLGTVPDPSLGPDGHRRLHTDIIAHSTPYFPVRTGEEFSAFFAAVIASQDKDIPSPTPIESFLASHPSANAFLNAPKPHPLGFEHESFWSVTAYELVSPAAQVTTVRYQFCPVAGAKHLSPGQLKEKGPDYLSDRLRSTDLRANPVQFKLVAQIAPPGKDVVVDDATVRWPGTEDPESETLETNEEGKRAKVVVLGTVALDALVSDGEQESLQKRVVLDPCPRGVEGVRPSRDPLLEMRSAVYLISGGERRGGERGCGRARDGIAKLPADGESKGGREGGNRGTGSV
ncbi:MAG: hypothetical protein Q9160_003539 [Pyrenula sp. 1 TL-2023]